MIDRLKLLSLPYVCPTRTVAHVPKHDDFGVGLTDVGFFIGFVTDIGFPQSL